MSRTILNSSHTYNIGLIKYARAREKRKRANSCEFWPGSVPLVLLVSLEIVCLGVTIVTHQARFVKSLCCFCQSKHNLGVVKWWLHRCAAVIVGTGLKPPDPPKYHRGSPTRQPTLEATLCQLLRSPAGRVFSLAGEASGARPFCPDSVQERGRLSPFRQCHSSHSTNCLRKYPINTL